MFWWLHAQTESRKDVSLSGQIRAIFEAFNRATNRNTYNDHMDVAEHLRKAKNHIEDDGHELRKAGPKSQQNLNEILSVSRLQRTFLLVRGTERLLQIVKDQPAIFNCSNN